MNRRRFLKMLAVGALVPFLPQPEKQPVVFKGYGLNIPANSLVVEATFSDGTRATGMYVLDFTWEEAKDRPLVEVHKYPYPSPWSSPSTVLYETPYHPGQLIAFRRESL